MRGHRRHCGERRSGRGCRPDRQWRRGCRVGGRCGFGEEVRGAGTTGSIDIAIRLHRSAPLTASGRQRGFRESIGRRARPLELPTYGSRSCRRRRPSARRDDPGPLPGDHRGVSTKRQPRVRRPRRGDQPSSGNPRCMARDLPDDARCVATLRRAPLASDGPSLPSDRPRTPTVDYGRHSGDTGVVSVHPAVVSLRTTCIRFGSRPPRGTMRLPGLQPERRWL